MKYQRGDIVLVSYPFADGSGSKVRPALVIQCDVNNRRLGSTLIAQITSRIRYARSEATQLLIEVRTPEGQQSGLIHDSAVSCDNLFTIRQDLLKQKIGSLPADVMKQIDLCLKASLGIV